MAAACKHEWVGGADGVTCRLCGAHLTHDEYVAQPGEAASAKLKPAKKPANKKK